MPIEVVVGSGEHKFYVHEGLIRAHSPFFDVALNKVWREGAERIIKLPEEVPEVFKKYIQWLYSNQIHVKSEKSLLGYPQLAKLYVLGERFMDHKFKDCVIDAMVTGCRTKEETLGRKRHFPDDDSITAIYEGTPVASPARRLMVDLHVTHGHAGWISKSRDKVNHEFALDLATALLEKRCLNDKERKDHADIETGIPCSYHYHAKDQPCGGEGK